MKTEKAGGPKVTPIGPDADSRFQEDYTRCNPWNDAGCTFAQTLLQLDACTAFDQTLEQRCGTSLLDGARGRL